MVTCVQLSKFCLGKEKWSFSGHTPENEPLAETGLQLTQPPCMTLTHPWRPQNHTAIRA
jgi:hypothetical protein